VLSLLRVLQVASAEVVSRTPGGARMQVSGHFCFLTSPQRIVSGGTAADRSQSGLFPQVKRLKFREPFSDRWLVGSIAVCFSAKCPISRWRFSDRWLVGSIAVAAATLRCTPRNPFSDRWLVGSIAV
jgi:hypothetical protein